jgi:hypothetical protein
MSLFVRPPCDHEEGEKEEEEEEEDECERNMEPRRCHCDANHIQMRNFNTMSPNNKQSTAVLSLC